MTAFAAVTLEESTLTVVGSPTEAYGGTFNPSVIDPQGVAKLYDFAQASIDARRGLSLSVRLPKVGGSVARVTAKVVIPLLDGQTPPAKVGEVIGTMEFVIPKRATEIQRNAILQLCRLYMFDASVVAAVGQLESIY